LTNLKLNLERIEREIVDQAVAELVERLVDHVDITKRVMGALEAAVIKHCDDVVAPIIAKGNTKTNEYGEIKATWLPAFPIPQCVADEPSSSPKTSAKHSRKRRFEA